MATKTKKPVAPQRNIILSMAQEQLHGCCGIEVWHNLYVTLAGGYGSVQATSEEIQKYLRQELDDLALHYNQEVDDDGNPVFNERGPPGMVLYACTQQQKNLQKALKAVGFQPLPGFINPRSGNTITLYYKIINQPS